jgi:hypothetical protein
MLLFRLFHAAESDKRLAARLGWRHSTFDVFLDGHVEVRGHLGFKVRIMSALAK